MASAGEIRAGGAAVECRFDQTQFDAGLQAAASKLTGWANRINSAGAKVDVGKIGGVDVGAYDALFMSVFTRVRGLRHVIEAATAATAAFRGEWDRAAEAARSLPLVKEMEDFIRTLAGRPSAKAQEESIKGVQDLIARSQEGGLKLVETFDRLRFDTQTAGLRDMDLEIAKIDEEARKLTEEAWANPSTDDRVRATLLGQIQLWREGKIAAAETKKAGAEAWKEISEGADRDVKAREDMIEELHKGELEEQKKFGDDMWDAISESADRQVAATDERLENMERFYRELDRLGESVMTPVERIRATEEDLRIRLGLEPGSELYRRVMDKALGEGVEEGLRGAHQRTIQARGTYSGVEAALLGRGGGPADAILDVSKQQLVEQKKIALAAEAGFRWSN